MRSKHPMLAAKLGRAASSLVAGYDTNVISARLVNAWAVLRELAP